MVVACCLQNVAEGHCEYGLIIWSMGLTNHWIPNLNFNIMAGREEGTLLNPFRSCMVSINLDWF